MSTNVGQLHTLGENFKRLGEILMLHRVAPSSGWAFVVEMTQRGHYWCDLARPHPMAGLFRWAGKARGWQQLRERSKPGAASVSWSRDGSLWTRSDGACVWLKPTGGWCGRGPSQDSPYFGRCRSAESAMREVDRRWPSAPADTRRGGHYGA